MKRSVPISAKAKEILRANPSVVGFSEVLMPKLVKGKPTAIMAIRVFVEKKLPKSKIPAGNALPKKIGNIPVDVEQIGRIEPLDTCANYGAHPIRPIPNRGRFVPVLGGASGHYTANSRCATLGYFVRDRRPMHPPQKPQWYALSCAHVLQPPPALSAQNETIQPSIGDGGIPPQHWIGKESLYTYDDVDAAISQIDIGARAELIDLPVPVGTGEPEIGMTVAKSGRTTGVTHGTITADRIELNFQRWGTSPNPVRFIHVFQIEREHGCFACGGDSGSLIIQPARKIAIGLLFGGDIPTLRRIYASPIDLVMSKFPGKILVKPGETYP